VTGDNLGQVASQTLDNLNSVYRVATGIILSPLLGLSKNEIIGMARAIGTYEQSIRRYPDCCTYFVPKHPELRATPDMLNLTESELDIPALVKLGIESAEMIKI
jgi:thiamine biosynthesis protein ThiI